MAIAKQINWGYQFKRNYRGPIDPDAIFATYTEMITSPLIYNGAIVSVTDDANDERNGIYLILGDDNTGEYTFQKGSNEAGILLPFLVTYSTKVISVEYQSDTDDYKVTLKDNEFANLDIIGWAIADDLSSGEYAVVEYTVGDSIYLGKSSKRPAAGDTIYQVGNTVDVSRAAFPVIYMKKGYGNFTVFQNSDINNLNKIEHTYIGKDNIGNPLLYSLNTYLKGTFISTEGTDLGAAVKDLGEEIETGLNNVREEFSFKNRITNPFFLEKMKGWTTVNDANFFRTLQDIWIWNTNKALTQNGLYAVKRKGAYIDTFNNKVCLSIQEGIAYQEASNLKKIISDKEEEYPKLMDISFMYYVTKGGTLKITLGSNSSTLTLDASTDWEQLNTQLSWDGAAGLEISFTNGTKAYAEIKIRTVIFQENEVETFKNKYAELFSYSDTLVKMAKEYSEGVGT
jgi:hypothetical protein